MSKVDLLNLVLQCCTENKGIFTTGERIVINQLRAYYLSFDNPNPNDSKNFDLNEPLQSKLNRVIKDVKSNFEPRKRIEIVWQIEQ